MIIKEYVDTDLVYYSRLSDTAQDKINSIKTKIKDLIDYLNDNSVILTTVNDRELIQFDYDEPNDIEDNTFLFDDYLADNNLTKKFPYKNDNYYIREDENSSFINDFLYEFEDSPITFTTVLDAIAHTYLSYDDYYDTLISANLNTEKIDEAIKNDVLSIDDMDLEEIIYDYNNAIIDLEKDISLCIYDVKDNVDIILNAYKEFIKLEV